MPRPVRGHTGALVLILSLTLPPAALAQATPERTERAPVQVRDSTAAAHVQGMVFGAGLGATLGLVGGGLLGYKLETAASSTCYDECGLGGAILGAWVGTAVLTPVLTHAMGGKQGNLAAGILATSLSTLAVAALSVGIEQDVASVVFAVPLGAAVTAILVEERTGRSR